MTSMIQVARMGQADVDSAAEILFEAFGSVYRRRGHNPPFPTLDSAAWLCRAYLDLDPVGCIVAVSGSRMVGVGFAHPRGGVTSIGPLAARPGAPAGVARALMRELGAASPRSTSFRLFQDAFNPDSFGLYTRLGYVVADVAPYLLADRLEPASTPPSPEVRALRPDDMPGVERYDRARSGADRRADLALLAASGGAFVSIGPDHGLAGYLFYRALPARVVVGPGVADSAEALAALLDTVAAALPGRPAVIRASAAAPVVVRRAFERGFRVDHLGNLMVAGPYRPPPAQLYPLFPESL